MRALTAHTLKCRVDRVQGGARFRRGACALDSLRHVDAISEAEKQRDPLDPHPAPRQPHRRRREPRRHGVHLPDGIDAAKEQDEDILDDVVDVRIAAHETIGQARHVGRMPLEQLVQSLVPRDPELLAAPRSGRGVLAGRLHTRITTDRDEPPTADRVGAFEGEGITTPCSETAERLACPRGRTRGSGRCHRAGVGRKRMSRRSRGDRQSFRFAGWASAEIRCCRTATDGSAGHERSVSGLPGRLGRSRARPKGIVQLPDDGCRQAVSEDRIARGCASPARRIRRAEVDDARSPRARFLRRPLLRARDRVRLQPHHRTRRQRPWPRAARRAAADTLRRLTGSHSTESRSPHPREARTHRNGPL